MVPPGIPDFMTRRRTLPVGDCLISGRAWSGWGPIVAVEVSSDGGSSWAPAELEHDGDVGDWAWRGWSFLWQPRRAGTRRARLPRNRRSRQHPTARAVVERRRLREQRGATGHGHPARRLTRTDDQRVAVNARG